VLPLVARVQKSFQAWLRPGFGPFRFDYNADRLEALASERAVEWERVGKAAFIPHAVERLGRHSRSRVERASGMTRRQLENRTRPCPTF
jgi:phage portal protein BeeE